MSILDVERRFSSLGVRDLLEARDQYHWHLTHLENVLGTAVGRYLQRGEEHEGEPRTFQNSEVRPDSWPCILVLVKDWVWPAQFGTKKSHKAEPSQMVPSLLYLTDGRTVPVCVVKVDPEEPSRSLLPRWTWPRTSIGGGFPLISAAQGRDNIASAGALVTDGHTTYALTSRHVSGPAGHVVSTILNGRRVEIGRSVDLQIVRRPFTEVYADYPGRRSSLTVDAGLIAVDDVEDWTSQIYGLPPFDELADLSEHNISTRMIGAPVRAYGAASGLLEGRIAALFYRHRSIGGYDDITDFLIAPANGSAGSQPGDSGTVWHLVEESTDDQGGTTEELRPLALQWGGQALSARSEVGNFNFTLAAGLTNVLRLLDVELVTDHNSHAQPFWGKTGHYSLATLACSAVTTATVKELMEKNVARISFPLDGFTADAVDDATKAAKKAKEFIPLADVPDLVWKDAASQIPGGRSGRENPGHHADTDVARASDGKTLRQLSLDDPARNVDPQVWLEFYEEVGITGKPDQGSLPFRVWQFFDAMVDAVRARSLVRYVAAAGALAHYVGDACQPHHGSHLHDGIEEGDVVIGKGVHSAYESAMVDHRAAEIIAGVQTRLTGSAIPAPADVTNGHDAAVATVRLMEDAAERIDPEEIARFYAATTGGTTSKSRAVTTALWEKFGEKTMDNMADGAQTLAMLWNSAWAVGDGSKIRTAPRTISEDDLRACYEDPEFVPSAYLEDMGPLLR